MHIEDQGENDEKIKQRRNKETIDTKITRNDDFTRIGMPRRRFLSWLLDNSRFLYLRDCQLFWAVASQRDEEVS